MKRKVEITIISAEGLKLSSIFGKPHTYCVLSVHPRKKFYTRVEEEGGRNPAWNHKFILSVDNYTLEQGKGKFMVEIFQRGHIHDKVIGTVEIPFDEIPYSVRSDFENHSSVQYMAFEIRRPSGRTKGILNVSIRLKELCRSESSSSSSSSDSEVERPVKPPYVPPTQTASSPPRAYPPSSPPRGYPPSSYATPAYATPAPPAYGAPPTPGYGYPAYGGPAYQAGPGYYSSNPKSSSGGHSNLALGAGIAAGALGGLVLGEVVEDIAENAAEDAVYDDDY